VKRYLPILGCTILAIGLISLPFLVSALGAVAWLIAAR
jgi:hypothetical protein